MTRIACIPDTHSPYHDKRALELAIKVIKSFRPDVLVHMGDIADMYAISSYDKDPRKSQGFLSELREVNKVFDQIDGLAPRKIFLCGNHEARLEKYLFKKAPELHDYVTIPQAFDLKRRGWEYYPYQVPVKIGKLYFVHDLGFSGKYSLAQTMDAFPGNIIMAHTHRLEMRVRGNLKREKLIGANFGWLGDSNAIDYLPSVKIKQDWARGFGLIELEKDGTPHVEPVEIRAGKCFFRGKEYR